MRRKTSLNSRTTHIIRQGNGERTPKDDMVQASPPRHAQLMDKDEQLGVANCVRLGRARSKSPHSLSVLPSTGHLPKLRVKHDRILSLFRGERYHPPRHHEYRHSTKPSMNGEQRDSGRGKHATLSRCHKQDPPRPRQAPCRGKPNGNGGSQGLRNMPKGPSPNAGTPTAPHASRPHHNGKSGRTPQGHPMGRPRLHRQHAHASMYSNHLLLRLFISRRIRCM